MKKNNKFIIVLLLILAVVGIYLIIGTDIIGLEEKKVEVFGDLEVHFIDVGQGDAALIKNKEHSMVIDAGTNGSGKLVVEYIRNQGVSKLDYVIGTHPHEDHIGGLDDVIDAFEVENVIMPDVAHNTKTFEDVLNSVSNKGLGITKAKSGNKYELGDSEFTILAPNLNVYPNLNDYSVSIKLVYGTTSFVLTGDAEKASEFEMVDKYGGMLKADVLSLGHHGSNTSSTAEFLNKVKPSVGIISAGIDNKYGHPNDDVVERLESMGVVLYGTYEHGDIVVISDGEKITVQDGYTFNGSNSNIMDTLFKIKDFLINDLFELGKELELF